MGSEGFLALLYGVLFEPRRTFRAGEPPPGAGAAVLTVALVSTLGAVARGGGAAAILRALAGFAGTLVGLAALALALGFMAELLGGSGRVTRLWTLLGLTRAPHLLALPLTALGRQWPAVGSLGDVLAGVWALVLVVLALRAAYRLTTGQAAAAVALAVGAAVAVPVVLLILVVLAGLADPATLEGLRALGGI